MKATLTIATQKYIDTAYNIGKHLCREAIWYKDQCNWIGHEVCLVGGQFQNAVKACGLELYGGVSGIALFLTELNSEVNDPIIERTLKGALQTILKQIDTSELDAFGYYSGKLGIAITLFKIGLFRNDEALKEKALSIINSFKDKEIQSHEIDVIAGAAGAIPSLLKLYSVTQDDNHLQLAIKCGDFLVKQAIKEDDVWFWKTVDPNYGLTGYSHGASGIAVALLELYTHTQNETYWEGAMFGFQYEKKWFNTTTQNWPDLRQYNGQGTPHYGTMWCHGAPGIALANLKAFQLTKHEYFLEEARIALNTTKNSILKELQPNSGANYSLCHGLAGNTDVLLYANQILNTEEFLPIAQQVADRGISLYTNTRTLFPSGVNDPSGITTGQQENHGLMLGLSGTGYFYLRLANRDQIGTALMP